MHACMYACRPCACVWVGQSRSVDWLVVASSAAAALFPLQVPAGLLPASPPPLGPCSTPAGKEEEEKEKDLLDGTLSPGPREEDGEEQVGGCGEGAGNRRELQLRDIRSASAQPAPLRQKNSIDPTEVVEGG